MPRSMIEILAFGKAHDAYRSEINRYIDRISVYTGVSVRFLKPETGKWKNRDDALKREKTIMEAAVHPESYSVALSEEGRMLTSRDFACWMKHNLNKGKTLCFHIGSAFGLHDSFKRSCCEVLSLSPLTFPHRLCLCIVLEQIYRGFTILQGHPYHKSGQL